MADKNLPDFDEMVKMALEEPEKLEKLRQEMINDVITSAPIEHQEKLKHLQTRINLITRGSKNSLDATIKLSKEMMKSFNNLNNELNGFVYSQIQDDTKDKPKLTITKKED